MRGIATVEVAAGLPAVSVLRLRSDRPVKEAPDGEGAEVVLAAVSHPPRIGEARPIAALLPEVLARYGLSDSNPTAGSKLAPGAWDLPLPGETPGPSLVPANAGFVPAIDCEA